MPELIKFAVTVRADDAPELYEILSKISYGRGRSEKLKMLATEFLQGNVKGISVHDLRTMLSEGMPPVEGEEKKEKTKKTIKNSLGIAATRLCIADVSSGFGVESDPIESGEPSPIASESSA